MDECTDEEKIVVDQTIPLSLQNELKVLKKIKEMCRDRLSLYPHTTEYDEELLKEKHQKLTYNQRICIRYRLGEKRVLLSTIEMCDAMVTLSGRPIQSVALLMNHHPYNKHREYVEKALIPLLQRESLWNQFTPTLS